MLFNVAWPDCLAAWLAGWLAGAVTESFSSTSLKTTFAVANNGSPGCCMTANLSPSGSPVLEEATYNCPWVKTGDHNHTPIL